MSAQEIVAFIPGVADAIWPAWHRTGIPSSKGLFLSRDIRLSEENDEITSHRSACVAHYVTQRNDLREYWT